jgi:hypothetical protein
MCGGEILAAYDATYGKCDSCGTTSTLTMSAEERIINKFNRANELFIKREFDRASKIYEEILDEDSTDPEVYWCLALCRYGVEYVSTPGSPDQLPVCHRKMKTPITSDPDYLAIFDYIYDDYTKKLYEAEANRINEMHGAASAPSDGIKKEPDRELSIEEIGVKEGFRLLDEEAWGEAKAKFKEVMMTNSRFAPAYTGLFCADEELIEPEEYIGDDLFENKYIKLALEYADPVYHAELERFDRIAKDNKKQLLYDKLIEHEKTADSEAELMALGAHFNNLGDYKNASRYAASCRERAREQGYIRLLSQKGTAVTVQELYDLQKNFEGLGDYRDAPQLAAECVEAANEMSKSQTYEELLQRVQSAGSIEEFNSIGNGFKALGEYRDAQRLATECFDHHFDLVGDMRKRQKRESFRQFRSASSLILAIASAISFFIVFSAFADLRSGLDRVGDSAVGYVFLYAILFVLFSVLYFPESGNRIVLRIISFIVANLINLGTLFVGSRTSSQLLVGRPPSEFDVIVGWTMTISCLVYFLACLLACLSKKKY